MAKTCIWLITLVPLLAFQTMPASACNVVGYANGEPLCATTSDGHGQPYTDARPRHVWETEARAHSQPYTKAQYVNRHGLDILRRR
jgi:hypothetical protein